MVSVAEHADSHCLLVAFEECIEAHLELMTTFIRYVTKKHRCVTHLLSLGQISLKERDQIVRITQFGPLINIVVVTTLCVNRDHSCFKFCDVFRVAIVLVVA